MAASSIRLIIGLGNPGAEYRDTRHNAGFWFVDRLADDARAGWQRQARQQCELARVRLGVHEVWLMKPATFMNGSGAAVQSVAAFYRIAPAEMLVVHDEIDLPPGTIRLKFAGGHGGHNGLRDIIACVSAEFWRLRLGVGHPGDKDRVVDAVLSRASRAEQQLIDKALARGLAALPLLLDGASQAAMQQLHSQNEEPEAP
jgi:PTH1 family peptidyl-tRNA hydrolase